MYQCTLFLGFPPWNRTCKKVVFKYYMNTTPVQTLFTIKNLWIERCYRIIVLFCDRFKMPGARDELLQTAQLKFLEQRLYIIFIEYVFIN